MNITKKIKYISLFLRRLFLITLFIIFVSIITIQSQQTAYKLEYPVNTVYDDFSPSLTSDGKTMVFNSRPSGESDHDIFISSFADSKWSKPQPIEIINSRFNDETPYITPDGRLLLFSSDRPDFTAYPEKKGYPSGKMTYNIYISEKTETGWSEPVKVPGEINTDNNERSPSLSLDKKTIFFTRWPYKYIKKSRIMQASYRDGVFISATELPPPINTDSYDISLTPSLDGTGYFFSSIREGGLGGWDLYFIEFKNGSWGEIRHLPRPINSEGNDLFLAETSSRVYFCSNRIRGYGGYDIYTSIRNENLSTGNASKSYTKSPETIKDAVESHRIDTLINKESSKNPETVQPEDKNIIPDSRSRVILHIIDSENSSPVSEKFTIYLKNTEDPTQPELRKVYMSSGEKGQLIVYPKNDVKWIVVKHESLRFSPVRIAIKIEQEITVESAITLYPVSITSSKPAAVASTELPILKPVYFDFNSSKIKISYYPYLHSVIDYLRKNPEVKIEITGRADTRGLEKNNRIISIKRAGAVRRYMTGMGIRKSRISIKGAGSRGSSWEGLDPSNRRAEITIIR